MATITIHFVNGKILSFDEVEYFFSGNQLVVIKKKSEVNNLGDAFLITTHTVYNLEDIKNFDVKIKTKKYAEE